MDSVIVRNEILPETRNTVGSQLVEELKDLPTNVFRSLVEIRHSTKFAVSDLLGVSVVFNISRAAWAT